VHRVTRNAAASNAAVPGAARATATFAHSVVRTSHAPAVEWRPRSRPPAPHRQDRGRPGVHRGRDRPPCRCRPSRGRRPGCTGARSARRAGEQARQSGPPDEHVQEPGDQRRLVTTLSARKPTAYSKTRPGLTATANAIAIDSPRARPRPRDPPRGWTARRGQRDPGGDDGFREHDPPTFDRLTSRYTAVPSSSSDPKHAGANTSATSGSHRRDWRASSQARGQARRVRGRPAEPAR